MASAEDDVSPPAALPRADDKTSDAAAESAVAEADERERAIFSGTNEELYKSKDPYIQNFLQGTEMDIEKAEQSQKTEGAPDG